MYTDRKHGRVLLRDGTSLVDSFSYARMILEDKVKENLYVAKDFHSDEFDYLNETTIGVPVQEIVPVPTSHAHTDDDLNWLWELIASSPRWSDESEFEARILEELEFFERTNNIIFVLSCYLLVEEFKKDGIVWGVGRGSSCASLIFYALGINDINPLQYKIKFSELSKEM